MHEYKNDVNYWPSSIAVVQESLYKDNQPIAQF
jgi:hypothetical protein